MDEFVDQVIHGDSAEVLKGIADNSVHLIATDPPFEWGFMQKSWDSREVATSVWTECFRILKPGGLAFVMSGPRLDKLWRRGAQLEGAGFDVEISPILYIYRQGFPKALDISKDFDKAAFTTWLKSVDDGLSKADFRKVVSAAVNGSVEATLTWKDRSQRRNQPPDNALIGGRSLASAGMLAAEHSRARHKLGTRLLASVIARCWEPLTELERLEAWKEHSVIALREYQKQTFAVGPDHQDLSLPPGVRVKVGDSRYKARRPNSTPGYGATICIEGGDRGAAIPDTAPSVDLAREWDGYKSVQFKPAYEVILVAQKPRIPGPIRKNVEEHGVGGINVAAAAIPFDMSPEAVEHRRKKGEFQHQYTENPLQVGGAKPGDVVPMFKEEGRFPANVICSDQALGEEGSRYFSLDQWAKEHGFDEEWLEAAMAGCVQIAKPAKNEKNAGLDEFPSGGIRPLVLASGDWTTGSGKPMGPVKAQRNNHPTCKPVKLMAWLLALGAPKGAWIVDPFGGSGTTGVAAVMMGMHYTIMDTEQHYCDIAEARIEYARQQAEPQLELV